MALNNKNLAKAIKASDVCYMLIDEDRDGLLSAPFALFVTNNHWMTIIRGSSVDELNKTAFELGLPPSPCGQAMSRESKRGDWNQCNQFKWWDIIKKRSDEHVVKREQLIVTTDNDVYARVFFVTSVDDGSAIALSLIRDDYVRLFDSHNFATQLVQGIKLGLSSDPIFAYSPDGVLDGVVMPIWYEQPIVMRLVDAFIRGV